MPSKSRHTLRVVDIPSKSRHRLQWFWPFEIRFVADFVIEFILWWSNVHKTQNAESDECTPCQEGYYNELHENHECSACMIFHFFQI